MCSSRSDGTVWYLIIVNLVLTTYFSAGCSADEKYDFQCPTFGLRQRFGDHDRLPHPKDCKLYFACLSNGRPRLNSCEEPLVFNPRSGFCDDQDNVPGCEGYYVEDEKDIAARDKLTEEIREQLLKELGLSSRSRVARSATDKAVDARSEVKMFFLCMYLFP